MIDRRRSPGASSLSKETPRRGQQKLWRRLISTKSAVLGLLLFLATVVSALGAPILTPYDPSQQHLQLRLRPPGFGSAGELRFLLGTDTLGRDVLSRILFGARISLLVGLSSVVISGSIGITLGLVAGFFGGLADSILSTAADIQQSVPFIALIIALAAAIGSGVRNVVLILGVTGWVSYYRVVRSETLSIRQREYVEAARAVGAGSVRIMVRHVLPNVAASVLVIATLLLAAVITSEAALSFLGLGIPPTIPTWGNMISEGREYVRDAWWLPVFPGLAISGTVLGVNLLGDWLRDVLDPRRRSI